jgi:uncharacterized damage-inducible protein DinB
MAMREGPPMDFRAELLNIWDINEHVNLHVLEQLPAEAWRGEPPGGGKSGRNVAAVFAHICNVRHMWLQTSAPDSRHPPLLDRHKCTPKEVAATLKKSGAALRTLVENALARPDGKVKDFPPGVAGLVAYMTWHEAHHRGQILQLARQAGYPMEQKAMYDMWQWNAMRKAVSKGGAEK